MSNEMIERVAKALCKKRILRNAVIEKRTLDDNFINLAIEVGYPNFMIDAKTAIEAMKEPTCEMLDAGAYDFDMTLERQYKQMIEAALKDD